MTREASPLNGWKQGLFSLNEFIHCFVMMYGVLLHHFLLNLVNLVSKYRCSRIFRPEGASGFKLNLAK